MNARHSRLLTIIFTLVFALSVADLAKADELYGRVRGTVTDQSGAVLPGVSVKITNPATGLTKEVTSGKDGSYEFLNLPPASYSISATKSGFKTYQLSNLTLLANQVYAAPIRMGVGTVSTEVVVQANPAQVEQSSMQLTSTISGSSIVNLPLNGRNWISLQQTLPGVVLADTRFGSNFSTNGSQGQQNSFLINGSDYNDLPLNSPLAAPSPDAIGEVRMITNTINPEYGRNSGAILNATTKSGTNSFHGTAFEFYRDTFLNTKNYFQKTPSVFHQNQYGGTVGGPVWKNKSFFFFSLQNTRNRTTQASGGLVTVFTPAQLTGDFSGLLAKISSKKKNPFPIQGESGAIFPAGTPWNIIFPTGHIPVADFNPLSVSLTQQFVPLPNFGTNQFSFQPISAAATNQYLGRFDQNITQKDVLWFYGFAQNQATKNTLPFTGSTLPGFGDQSLAFTKQFTTSWSHTITSNSLNELRLGYTRLNFQSTTPQNIVQPSAVGFPNIFPQFTQGAGYPFIGITGFFNLGFSTNGPQPRKDQTYQITDNYSWVKGKHSFKFGYEGRKFEVWNPFNARNNGSFSFGTSGKYSTGITGLNFLLGIPASYDQTAGGLIVADAYEHYGYFQDQWRVRDNLTLTYGFGYQIDTPIAEHQFNGISRICFEPGVQSAIFPTAPVGLVYPGDPGCDSKGGSTTKYNHFGPRVGFAYSPDLGWVSGGPGKMSIRGGFGVYTNRSEEELSLQDLGIPPNGLETVGISDLGGGRVPSFPNPFTDIAGKGAIPNKFPFVPPAPGTPFNFSQFFPLSLNTVDQNGTVPYAMNFNLTVERELPSQTIVRLGYVGALGRKLVTSYDRNPVTQAGVAACLADPACFGDPGNQDVNFPSHQQFPGNIFGGIGWERNAGTSNYHSLQLTVDKHTTHGLQVLGTYTLSHALDVSSSYEDTAFVGAGSFDPYGRLGRDYGNAAFDTRHRFVVSFTYDIPNLNKVSMFSRIPSRIFGGWGVTGINIMQTGQPIILSDFNQNSLTCPNHIFYSCPDRPDLVKQPVTLDPRASTSTFGGQNTYFFDPASFTDNALGTLGNSGRNNVHGPGFWNTDFAVMKNTSITERTAIQLRLEAFNLFNHTNFNNPIGEFTSGNFGRVTNIRRNTNSRLVQLGAKFIF